MPVKRGRDFTDGDTRDAPFVAIVNEALARASFAGQDPIGRRIQCGLDSPEFMTIVGVVGDVRTAGPALPAQPEIFMPYEQHPGPATALNLIVRTESVDPLALADTIRREIAGRSSRRAGRGPRRWRARLETASATPRFRTFLLVVFAGVALVLALAGVYGVMATRSASGCPSSASASRSARRRPASCALILAQGAKLAALVWRSAWRWRCWRAGCWKGCCSAWRRAIR